MWRLVLLVFFIVSCSVDNESPSESEHLPTNTLFKRLPANQTGIEFLNEVVTQDDFDVFRYRNFYNGGGVAVADFNNDGLSDVYLTANMKPNKLFLNKGNWKFEDITESAGVKGTRIWSTGVSIADVNADGFLDIYVCNAGDRYGSKRENELFINNGDLTFTEKAAEYGLADKGFTTHAAFFDYDKDGDLDCYILNNSFRPISTLGYKNLRDERDPDGGDKLYRNDNGKYIDVSEKAGIFGSVIGFGLGVAVGDVNQDNWPDIYVSNDFYERDYLYINKHDGTFSEELESRLGHLSMFSMGADVGDLNNDGYPEIFSTDMLPDDDQRLKQLTSFESYDVYQLRLKNGYYHQFMRNMLQTNNGDGTFCEMGALAGVAASDWSWGALMADFDNDSYKEIFVCNGIYKDVTDLDFMEFFGSSEQIKAAMAGKKIDWKLFSDKMPSNKLSNFLFHRTGDWTYENKSKEWGLAEPSFSNGAAYGDLDNDGDLDLIVNNVNQELFVYKNDSREINQNNYLTIQLKGSGKNTFALGASIKAFVNNQVLLYDHMPIRGFQSSMDYRTIIGLGKVQSVDSILITWPDMKTELLKNIAVNQKIVVEEKNATLPKQELTKKTSPLVEEVIMDPNVTHHENDFNDFDRDRLLYSMLSTEGPAVAKGDLNKDGLDDIYLGGSSGYAGQIYLQGLNQKMLPVTLPAFEQDKQSEDLDAAFFDADSDGDLDLYVVSGGNESLNQSTLVLDRFYENTGLKNGKPSFEKRVDRIPKFYQNGSCVKPADIDNDGDLDLFIGSRVIPTYYGIPCDQYLLINDGKGFFKDATNTIAPGLRKLGMVTDATWLDFDKNGFIDLLIVGDWMPLTLFTNNGGKLTKADVPSFTNTNGWWNAVLASDLDNDGDVDIVAGNLGLNSKFKPSVESPIKLYVNDFDENGSMEPIYVYIKDGKEYPMALKPELVKQMTSLRKQFVYFKDYVGKTIQDVFDAKLIERATRLNVYQASSSMFINNGDGTFLKKDLPVEAQVSPVFGIEVYDLNHDGNKDIILGGNLSAVKPEIGKYDAMSGLILLSKGKNEFQPIKAIDSGLKVSGETRNISILKGPNEDILMFTRNNSPAKFYVTKK